MLAYDAAMPLLIRAMLPCLFFTRYADADAAPLPCCCDGFFFLALLPHFTLFCAAAAIAATPPPPPFAIFRHGQPFRQPSLPPRCLRYYSAAADAVLPPRLPPAPPRLLVITPCAAAAMPPPLMLTFFIRDSACRFSLFVMPVTTLTLTPRRAFAMPRCCCCCHAADAIIASATPALPP